MLGKYVFSFRFKNFVVTSILYYTMEQTMNYDSVISVESTKLYYNVLSDVYCFQNMDGRGLRVYTAKCFVFVLSSWRLCKYIILLCEKIVNRQYFLIRFVWILAPSKDYAKTDNNVRRVNSRMIRRFTLKKWWERHTFSTLSPIIL